MVYHSFTFTTAYTRIRRVPAVEKEKPWKTGIIGEKD